ncbi:class F sortase [Streptomyces flavidovirens]
MKRAAECGRVAAAMAVGIGLGASAAGLLAMNAPDGLRDEGVIPPATAATTARASTVRPSPPVEVRGPGGWRAAVVPVAVARDGALALPEDDRNGGWWALGAPAGAAQGTTLLAGHVDTRAGPGTFAALHSLPLRARVEVIGANGRTYPYTVVARRTYTQASLPPDLFTRDNDHRLALITCAGAYNPASHSYDRNLVLYATPATQEYRSTTRRR